MKLKTKSMTRWLAMVLCVITLFTLFMPAVSATENDAEPSEEAADAAETAEAEQEEAPEENSTERKLKEFIRRLNPNSLETVRGWAEPCVAESEPGTTYQFMRLGYFCKDPDSTGELAVFNRTVGLRDTFTKTMK